MRGVAM
jgi:dynein heavy chain, axonemal